MNESIFLNLENSDVKFEGIIFTNSVFEKDIETCGDIIFDNCTFNENVVLDNIKCREFSFTNCKFENEFIIVNSLFIIGSIYECKFHKKIGISSNNCSSLFVIRKVEVKEAYINGEYGTFQIVSSKIEKLVLQNINNERSHKESKIEFLIENEINEIRIKTFSTQSDISFKGGVYKEVFFEGVFEDRISFQKNVTITHLYFESSVFKRRIDFEDGNFEFINFYRSNFQGLVLINDFNYDKIINRNLKIHKITIHSCIYEMDMSVQLDKIEYIDLSNNNFKQIFNFNNYAKKLNKDSLVMISIGGTNQGNIIIENVYLDVTIRDINFGNLIFKDLNILNLYINEFQNEGNVTFTNVKSGLYFTIQDSISGKLNFLNFDVNIFKEIVISNCTLTGINFNKYPNKIFSFSKNPKIGYGLSEKSENKSNLRSVYNQLKHISRFKGNIEVSNKFQSKEYKQLLLSKKLDFDSILLFLNLISNNNGGSWIRGVLFTILVSFSFFILYLQNIGIVEYNIDSLKDYTIFISSFPKLELEKYSSENKLWNTKLIIWFARIFTTYGIYQTISAFRKYGKG